jgi:hypothetical protein
MRRDARAPPCCARHKRRRQGSQPRDASGGPPPAGCRDRCANPIHDGRADHLADTRDSRTKRGRERCAEACPASFHSRCTARCRRASARMHPEDLREVISSYQKCVAETVSHFGEGCFGLPRVSTEPSGSRRATPALLFQHSAGHFLTHHQIAKRPDPSAATESGCQRGASRRKMSGF